MSATTQETKQPPVSSNDSFFKKHGIKLIALLFWISLIGLYWWYADSQNLSIEDSIRRLSVFLTGTLVGGLAYILLYMLRPLILFPATLLTVLSGFIFGPVAGVIYTIIGSNASALVAYTVGYFFGSGVLDSEESAGLMSRYADRMRKNSFETVLIMRLLFLPYDLVNYTAGFLRIDWKAFILATAIGSVPGTISFVLLGSSFGTLDELLAGQISLNPVALGLSIALILVSLGISRYMKQREAKRQSKQEQSA